jgi:hypothetical protein
VKPRPSSVLALSVENPPQAPRVLKHMQVEQQKRET